MTSKLLTKNGVALRIVVAFWCAIFLISLVVILVEDAFAIQFLLDLALSCFFATLCTVPISLAGVIYTTLKLPAGLRFKWRLCRPGGNKRFPLVIDDKQKYLLNYWVLFFRVLVVSLIASMALLGIVIDLVSKLE